jgi:hypothetical protein
MLEMKLTLPTNACSTLNPKPCPRTHAQPRSRPTCAAHGDGPWHAHVHTQGACNTRAHARGLEAPAHARTYMHMRAVRETHGHAFFGTWTGKEADLDSCTAAGAALPAAALAGFGAPSGAFVAGLSSLASAGGAEAAAGEDVAGLDAARAGAPRA